MMDKDSVSGLTLQDLAAFPLDDFFDHYERGLKKVTIEDISLIFNLMMIK